MAVEPSYCLDPDSVLEFYGVRDLAGLPGPSTYYSCVEDGVFSLYTLSPEELVFKVPEPELPVLFFVGFLLVLFLWFLRWH